MMLSRLLLTIAVPFFSIAAQDTVRIRSTSAPQWGAEVRLTPVWSIGQVDGPDEIAFGRVSEATVDRTGRLYVYDINDAQVRQYDVNGKFVRKIGQKGKGPGEYEWVFAMDIADDSLLATFDLNSARFTFFSPDGTVKGTITDPRATNGFENLFAVDTRGLINFGVPARAADGSGAVEGPTSRQAIVMARRDGTKVDSLLLPPMRAPPPSAAFFLITPDGGNNNFLPRSHAAVLRSGGFVFGHGDAYRLIIRPPSGPVRVVERSASAVPVASEERADWFAWFAYRASASGQPNRYEIPSAKPIFRNLLTDHDSRIWVGLYAPARKLDLPPRPEGDKRPLLRWQQPATYDVFSNQGEYLARVQLPARSRMLTARGNRLWVLAKGDDDEDIIRLYTMSGVR